jgi:site-specific DNA recombinase
VTIHIANDRIDVKVNKDQATITTAAQLVRRGNELRIALPPDGASTNTNQTDPALVRLVVQGFAAREHLLLSTEIPSIADYDKRHLQRLARISWLAPDIITAILDGRQPVQLTARHLLRCVDIPLEWQQQRHFLGFS